MLSELSSSVQRALVMIGTAYLIFAVLIVIALCISTFFLVRIGVEFFRFGGQRQLLCPETRNMAAIRIDALHAAVSSLLAEPDLRVIHCSRWPERRGCNQACLGAIAVR